MKRKIYLLFLALSVSSLLTIFLVAKIKDSYETAFKEEAEECEWKMIHDPEMQLKDQTRWNESLLLSLGLLAPKTSNHIFNDSAFHKLPSTLELQNGYKCKGYEERAILQLTFRQVLKEITSDANQWCRLLRNLTNRVESCFSLGIHLEEFLVHQYHPNKTWRLFHTSETTSSQIMTTMQIYQALRLKRLFSKPTVVIPMANETDYFENPTVIYRYFFVISSLNPIEIKVFYQGLVSHDQEQNLFYPIKKRETSLALHDSVVRWLLLFLNQLERAKSTDKFKLVYQSPKILHIIAADFQPSRDSTLELFRIYSDVQRLLSKSSPTSCSMRLLLHRITRSAIYFLSSKNGAIFRERNSNSVLNEGVYDQKELFGLIQSLKISPFIHMKPSFQPKWTHYIATVPYETTSLYFQFTLNSIASDIVYENERSSNSLKINVGLGWNDFKITIHNKNQEIRPVIYLFRIERVPRSENPDPFRSTNDNITVCILEQECSLKFKDKLECGLQSSPLGISWRPALRVWNRLPTCTLGDSEGAWMVPCTSCRLERSCYWSRARWQPFECRYPVYSPTKLQQCLLHRKLIFVGDSTIRGMMESLLERLDGWLTMSDRTKWHGYRHRLANVDGQTQFDFDYYPKFWISSRPTLEQTLLHMLRRTEAKENDTTLIIGGLDWMSVQHFETIQRILADEGLSRMAVVIKLSGAGSSSDGRREGLVSTARRLGHLSQTARLRYGFRTVDTWNMTTARFRDFLPGRCGCHFHQITEVSPTQSDQSSLSIADAIHSARSPLRFRADGPINQAYTEILAHQLCGERGPSL